MEWEPARSGVGAWPRGRTQSHQKQRRETQEDEEAHAVGDGGQDHRPEKLRAPLYARLMLVLVTVSGSPARTYERCSDQSRAPS